MQGRYTEVGGTELKKRWSGRINGLSEQQLQESPVKRGDDGDYSDL